ncbi:hypothetical protein [Bradyrhizobium sp. UFLA05-112]
MFALVMGFALGGSVFWGVYGPNTTEKQANPVYEQKFAEADLEKGAVLGGKRPDLIREATPEGDEYWPAIYGYRLKVSDTLLVGFTFLLFLATVALWLATRALVKSADRNAGLQLRAYVSVQNCRTEEYEVGKPVSISVVAKNSGQTPSHNTTFVAALKYRLKSDKRPLTLKQSGPRSSSSLGSGAVESIKLISTEPLTQEQAMAIAKGDARIIVHGQIRYLTVFGDEAETLFGFHFDDGCVRRGDKILHVTSEGNSAT